MVLLMLLAIAGPASSQQADAAARCPTDKIVPAEVTTLLERARLCDHLAGEVGELSERGKQVSQASQRNQCDFVESELERMKKKFAANCQVRADIRDYEAARPQ